MPVKDHGSINQTVSDLVSAVNGEAGAGGNLVNLDGAQTITGAKVLTGGVTASGGVGGAFLGETWAHPPSGGDDTANLAADIAACPAGYKLKLWSGFYSFSALNIAGQPMTLEGAGWTAKIDALGTFGAAGYATNSNFGGTVLRCTAASGNGLAVTSTETNKVHLKGFALVGPGSGSAVGLAYGSAAHAIVKSDIDIGVMNFATGTVLTFVEDCDIRVGTRGCTTGMTAGTNSNQNRFKLIFETCTNGYAEDATCVANTFDNPLAQANSGTSLLVNTGHIIHGGYFENSSGVNAIEATGGGVIICPTLATITDGILLDANVRSETVIFPVARVSPIPFVDNSGGPGGTIFLGQSANFALSGTAVGKTFIDSYSGYATLPKSTIGAAAAAASAIIAASGSVLTLTGNAGAAGDSAQIAMQGARSLFGYDGATALTIIGGAKTIDLRPNNVSAFKVDTSGHLNSTITGTPATSALGANVTSATFTGNDVRGTIAIVMSGALAANTAIATCTFAASYGGTAPKVFLINQTAGVGLAVVNFYVISQSTGVSFVLGCDQALAAGTYTIGYIVLG